MTLLNRDGLENFVTFTRYLMKPPSYLLGLITDFNNVHNNKHKNNMPAINLRQDYFQNSLFPSPLPEWNKLDLKFRNSASLITF